MAADVAKIKGGYVNEISADFTFTALATTGKTVDFDGKAGYMVLLFTGSANDTITVVKGTQGVADIEVAIKKDKYHFLVLDDKFFLDGNKEITVKGASTSSVACIEIAN